MTISVAITSESDPVNAFWSGSRKQHAEMPFARGIDAVRAAEALARFLQAKREQFVITVRTSATHTWTHLDSYCTELDGTVSIEGAAPKAAYRFLNARTSEVR